MLPVRVISSLILWLYTSPNIKVNNVIEGGFFLVIFIRDFIKDELYIKIIDYYFWYIFGVFSGIYLAKKVFEKSSKIILKEQDEK